LVIRLDSDSPVESATYRRKGVGVSSRSAIATDSYYVPSEGFVQGVKVSNIGEMVFVSGVTARSEDGSIESVGDVVGQTRRILRNLEAVLEKAGGGLNDLVHTVTYLTDMGFLESVQGAKAEILGDLPCASTTVEVSRLVDPDQLLEIEAIAVIS
jgi:enamine deaminase RidA (YjgF/YER057c/UK114 family)